MALIHIVLDYWILRQFINADVLQVMPLPPTMAIIVAILIHALIITAAAALILFALLLATQQTIVHATLLISHQMAKIAFSIVALSIMADVVLMSYA